MGVDFEILKGRGRIKVLIFRWEENKMTEHKKMYKAGKRWVVATLTVASIAVAGTTVNSQVAHADTVSGTETQQVSNDGNSNAPVTGTAT